MNLINLPALVRLRDSFLENRELPSDYWSGEELLGDYEQTFARRIAWKWQWVLADLRRRGWSPPEGDALDWGCGTGAAGREYAQAFPTSALYFSDRSSKSVRFAVQLASQELPQTPCAAYPPDGPFSTLLLSHVLGELTEKALDQLFQIIARAQCIIWVEPGSHPISRKLIELRGRIMNQGFHAVAPCVHQKTCGLLASGKEHDWCHFFAKPPSFIFQDGDWARFGSAMGIDLRSLPLSYLVMDRRPPAPLPPGTVRILGRARFAKPHALLEGCDATGVADYRLTKRLHPDRIKKLKHDERPALQQWTLDRDSIVECADIDLGGA